MQLNKVQRIDDLSPRMLSVLSRTTRDYATQAVEILSKWSLWYLLQEIADKYSAWVNVISEFSDESSNLANKLSMIEALLENATNLPVALKTELIYLKWLIDYISVEHGRRQLALSETLGGIPWVMLKTRWSVNIILWSKDNADMRKALWK